MYGNDPSNTKRLPLIVAVGLWTALSATQPARAGTLLTVGCTGMEYSVFKDYEVTPTMYYSKNFTVEYVPGLDVEAIATEFNNHLKSKYSTRHVTSHCDTAADPAYVAERQKENRNSERWKQVEVDWPAATGKAVAPARKTPTTAMPGALVIEDSGVKARATAWENTLLQAKREAAQNKVEVAAQTAESRAKSKALMDKVIADLKQRGNKQ